MTYSPEIAQFAESHFGRKQNQPSPHELKAFYREVQPHLTHPILWFNSAQRQDLADAFGDYLQRERLTCYACAILSNHVHLLIRKHRLKVEEMSLMLKETGRRALRGTGLAPADHPVFSADICHMYKSDTAAMWNCIRYIERNFEKHGIRKDTKKYQFVVPYDNWPFHKR